MFWVWGKGLLCVIEAGHELHLPSTGVTGLSFETLVFVTFLLDARIEEFVYEKLDRKAPSRVNNPELLGQYMIDAGTEFGPGTAYGE